MEKLTPEERSKLGSKAALARWGSSPLVAICGSPDRPLKIGEIEIPCYVLQDGRRVLSQRGLQTGIGMNVSGGAQRMLNLVQGIGASPEQIKELSARITHPIKFQPPQGGTAAHGYEATIIADICDAILEARRTGRLNSQQQHVAERCEILVRGFSRVGIIALVDEATGYQEFRARDALSKILEAFIAKELQAWVPTFPGDFYHQMFRLRGLKYPSDSVRRPQYFGMLTNDLVYKRLAPGVLDELRRATPRDENGRLKHKLFQRLTTNVGYPKLREHLGSVVAIMKLSDGWPDFMNKLDRIHPRYGDTMVLPFDYDGSKDDGKGL